MQFTHGSVALSYDGKHVASEAGQAWTRFKENQGELKHLELALRSMLGGYPQREEGQSAADYLHSLPDTLGSQVGTRAVCLLEQYTAAASKPWCLVAAIQGATDHSQPFAAHGKGDAGYNASPKLVDQ